MEFTKEKQEEGQELLQSLIEKSWESGAFKKQFISNPQTAIESVTGKLMTIPKGKKIVVEDQTESNVIYINIPQKVNIDEFELTEEQLETVSGGVAWLAVIGVVAAGAQIIDWVGQGWNSVS